MNVFIYQAALLCEDCGEAQREHLDQAFKDSGAEAIDRDDESSYDSDRYPKGPFGDGGGEADSPQHCDQCREFLDNPLTPDGCAYVRTAWSNHISAGRGSLEVLQVWRDAYDYSWSRWTDWIETCPPLRPEAQKRFDELAG